MGLVILLRHFPTIHDVNNIYTPPYLNLPFIPIVYDEIKSLQSEIAEFFSAHNLRHVYHSDNPRGANSAKLLCSSLNCEHEIIKDDALNNILQPEWGNLSQDDIKNTKLYNVWHTNPQLVKFENGESLFDVKNRIDAFWERMSTSGGLVISHTTPMQVILCKLLKADISSIWCFKFDHFRFTVFLDSVMLRYNAIQINDINFGELRR